MNQTLTLAILISGSGSNLQAIIDAIESKSLDARIAVVISNQADAFGLMRAQNSGIPTEIASHRDYSSRAEFDLALIELLNPFSPDLIILAGFMRILSARFISSYPNRILNIHPSLLPKFKGTNTHQRVINAGEVEHGASVHLVSEQLDGGPIILQFRVTVEPGDHAEKLKAKVLEGEHQIYPQAIQMFAEGRVAVDSGSVIITPAESDHTGDNS